MKDETAGKTAEAAATKRDHAAIVMVRSFVPLAIVAGDIYLITASIPSVILPIVGLVSAGIQVKHKQDYALCMQEAGVLESQGLPLLKYIRYMQGLCYVNSISYFGFIYRPSDEYYPLLTYWFTLVNLVQAGFGIFCMVMIPKSTCKGGVYGIWAFIEHLISTVVCLIVLILTFAVWVSFKSKNKLPTWFCRCLTSSSKNQVQDLSVSNGVKAA